MSRARLTLVLVVLLAAVVAAVVLVQRARNDGEHVLGGPLFPVEMADVNAVLVTRDGLQFRLARHEGVAWTLRGALHIQEIMAGLNIDPRLQERS